MGVGRDAMDDLAFKPFFAINAKTPYGILRLESDGQQVNIGFNIPIDTKYQSYVMFTPKALTKEHAFSRQVVIGLGIKDTIWGPIYRNFQQIYLDKKSLIQDILQEEINKAKLESKVSDNEKKAPPKSHVVLDHMQKGLEYYYQGQYKLSLKEYFAVTTLMPDLAIGYTRLGSIYYKLDKKELALKQWEKAISLEPENLEIQEFIRHTKEELKEKSNINSDTELDKKTSSENELTVKDKKEMKAIEK
jgi:tetratricopeptide (TPR) repeat protein